MSNVLSKATEQKKYSDVTDWKIRFDIIKVKSSEKAISVTANIATSYVEKFLPKLQETLTKLDISLNHNQQGVVAYILYMIFKLN